MLMGLQMRAESSATPPPFTSEFTVPTTTTSFILLSSVLLRRHTPTQFQSSWLSRGLWSSSCVRASVCVCAWVNITADQRCHTNSKNHSMAFVRLCHIFFVLLISHFPTDLVHRKECLEGSSAITRVYII